jgi:hypothetical protein
MGASPGDFSEDARMIGRFLSGALCAILFAAPAAAQTTTGTSCSQLQSRYDEDMRTAHSVVMQLTNKILQGGSTPNVLSQLGLDLGSVSSAEQAVRKGAIAAMSPPAQNAILIYLLSANTTMQEMIWKGCKPPGG